MIKAMGAAMSEPRYVKEVRYYEAKARLCAQLDKLDRLDASVLEMQRQREHYEAMMGDKPEKTAENLFGLDTPI